LRWFRGRTEVIGEKIRKPLSFVAPRPPSGLGPPEGNSKIQIKPRSPSQKFANAHKEEKNLKNHRWTGYRDCGQ